MKQLVFAAISSAVVLSAAGLAYAGPFNTTVKAYDANTYMLTLASGETIQLHKYQDVIPATLSAGDEISMDRAPGEDGPIGISIKITTDR